MVVQSWNGLQRLYNGEDSDFDFGVAVVQSQLGLTSEANFAYNKKIYSTVLRVKREEGKLEIA